MALDNLKDYVPETIFKRFCISSSPTAIYKSGADDCAIWLGYDTFKQQTIIVISRVRSGGNKESEWFFARLNNPGHSPREPTMDDYYKFHKHAVQEKMRVSPIDLASLLAA